MENTASTKPTEIGALFSGLYHRMMASVLSDLRDMGFDDLSGNSLYTLVRLDGESATARQLASRLDRSRFTTENLLGLLEHRGYIFHDDIEPSAYRLTERGQHALSVIRDSEERVESRWMAIIGSAEYAQLRRSLEEIFTSEISIS